MKSHCPYFSVALRFDSELLFWNVTVAEKETFYDVFTSPNKVYVLLNGFPFSLFPVGSEFLAVDFR
jgi:hypothetical protein